VIDNDKMLLLLSHVKIDVGNFDVQSMFNKHMTDTSLRGCQKTPITAYCDIVGSVCLFVCLSAVDHPCQHSLNGHHYLFFDCHSQGNHSSEAITKKT
jgi:hypothetical protein